MTILDFPTELGTAVGPFAPDEAQLAAMAFLVLVRCAGRRGAGGVCRGPRLGPLARRVGSRCGPRCRLWSCDRS
jgi:hypothetical protein